jgi:4-azaleucine resistance transporter AzlC
MERKDILKKAFKASLPVMGGYLMLGMGFGILLDSAGYGLPWAFCMSLFIFAGSMQYALVPMMAGGASLLTVALSTFVINFRHIFYGLSMIDRYKGAGRKKPYLIFALTDETYSLVSVGNDDMEKKDYLSYCFWLSLMDHSYWVAGSVLGSLLGDFLPFDTEGVDFVLTALFIAILVQQWTESKDKRPALIGLGVTLLCRMVFGAANFLIPSMLLMTLALFLIRPKEERS